MPRVPEFQTMLETERKQHRQEVAQLKAALKEHREFATGVRRAFQDLEGRELQVEIKECLQDLTIGLRRLKNAKK